MVGAFVDARAGTKFEAAGLPGKEKSGSKHHLAAATNVRASARHCPVRKYPRFSPVITAPGTWVRSLPVRRESSNRITAPGTINDTRAKQTMNLCKRPQQLLASGLRRCIRHIYTNVAY